MTDERILSSGVFVEQVLKEANEKTKGPYTARDRKKRVEELILERCKKGNISVSELKGGSRRGTIPGVRAEITKCLVDSYGLPLAEVARQVGVSTSAISKALRRAEK
jgi:hypothetical protein